MARESKTIATITGNDKTREVVKTSSLFGDPLYTLKDAEGRIVSQTNDRERALEKALQDTGNKK